ncbi:hypothetical protein NE237_015760 [Protea cynaroides]|uniref:Uncharacterized protein n=1 Tax=Protea cynaroides TaxID=273540 RepID=A0A9Q0QRI5_9MAGN|nr:hypothetical protein NE237_015760 [Protea cynaroides]
MAVYTWHYYTSNRQPCWHSRTRRRLRREFCHRRLLLGIELIIPFDDGSVKDGECPRDAMWSSIRRRTDRYVGDLYEKIILGNLDYNSYRPSAFCIYSQSH